MEDIMRLCDVVRETGFAIHRYHRHEQLKAAKALADEHVAQILGYLRASRVEHGLLINFGTPKFEIKKYALSQPGQGFGIGGFASLWLSTFASLAPFRG